MNKNKINNVGIPYDWFDVIVDKDDIADLCYAFSKAICKFKIDKYENESKFWYNDEIDRIIELLESAKKILDRKDKDYDSHIVTSECRLSSSLSEAINNAETIKSIGNVVKKVKKRNLKHFKFISL